MIEGEQGTYSEHNDHGFADAPPYESDVQMRDISEDSADRHRGALAEIAKRIVRVLEKTGVMQALEEHPELSFDEVFERVHGRRRRSRFLNDLLCSFADVPRSVQAATSPREDLIGTIIGVQPALELICWFLAMYEKVRAHEVPVEIAWDASLGHAAVHDDQHDAFVERELRGCLSDLPAVITRLRGLCAALAKERTCAVRATMYSDTGGDCEAELALRESARRHEWRGLAVYGVDGTTARIPDSPDNRGFFGSQSAGEKKGLSGYPLARVVTLMALRSHLLVAAAIGPYGDERPMAVTLWPKLPDNSLVIVDRNFLAANILLPIERAGETQHWLTRAKSSSKWKVLKKLGTGDELIEVEVSSEARRKNPELPKLWTMRAIRYQRRGFRPQILLTSLLDHKAYPASEVRTLYHERWELELGFDEVKTHMLEREEAIRSKTPPGAMQELWAIGLAYNLVRLEMEQVAKEAGVPPSRVSFVMSLRLIRDEWMWAASSKAPGAIPANLRRLREELKRFILPPRRTARSFPRAVKIKMSSYARKRPTVLK